MVLKNLRHQQGLCIPGKRHKMKKKKKQETNCCQIGRTHKSLQTGNFLGLVPIMPRNFLLWVFTAFVLITKK